MSFYLLDTQQPGPSRLVCNTGVPALSNASFHEATSISGDLDIDVANGHCKGQLDASVHGSKGSTLAAAACGVNSLRIAHGCWSA